MKDGELKTVGTYYNAASAQLAQGLLKNHGIISAVFGDVSSYPNLTFADQVKLKVNEEDYEEAKKILAASDKAE